MKIKFICEQCGKKTEQNACIYDRFAHHYCGAKCAGIGRMKHKRSYEDTLDERIKKLIKSGELKKGA